MKFETENNHSGQKGLTFPFLTSLTLVKFYSSIGKLRPGNQYEMNDKHLPKSKFLNKDINQGRADAFLV